MTEQESPTGAPGPHVSRLRRWMSGGPRAVALSPHARSATVEPLVSRVAACALGLAYARREDVDGLRELVDIAEASEEVLIAARERLTAVEVIDEETRQRADALLYTAVGHLDRLVERDA